MTDIPDISAADLLAAYRSRTLSPLDVVCGVLNQVEAWDGTLNALWTVETEAALAAGRASEKRCSSSIRWAHSTG
jgi:aspartyl-tRNA(Asn)/glutamyl-tRNA(Gln) amidotransferase subunit A